MIQTWDTDAALAREAELLADVSGAPYQRFLWFWQAPQSLVAPRKLAAKPGFDAAAATLAKAGWPVFLRATGGDVTPQGPGIVNVTHVYASPAGERFDLNAQYDRLCVPIETALGPGASRGWQPGAFCDGAHNVQYGQLKFAGTALRLRPARGDKSRYAVLAHALMLFRPPPDAAITAINHFLEALGEERVIDPAAHTGLPPDLSEAGFLRDLHQAFGDLPDLSALALSD